MLKGRAHTTAADRRTQQLETQLAQLGTLYVVTASVNGVRVLKEVLPADTAAEARQQIQAVLTARAFDPVSASIFCARTTPRSVSLAAKRGSRAA